MLCNFQSILVHKGTVNSSLLSFSFWISYFSAFLPGESHGQRSLEGYDPLGQKETWLRRLSTHACSGGSYLPFGENVYAAVWEVHVGMYEGTHQQSIINRPPTNTSHASEPCEEWILYTLSIFQIIAASADNLTAALWEPLCQNHLAKMFLDFWPQKSV